jgi:hypothetical protein
MPTDFKPPKLVRTEGHLEEGSIFKEPTFGPSYKPKEHIEERLIQTYILVYKQLAIRMYNKIVKKFEKERLLVR